MNCPSATRGSFEGKGTFITIEGVEGCGKSTQMELARARLVEAGYRVDVTREPGGTPLAEAIRALLLDPANTALAPTAELLLYAAARAQHVAERIRPALEAGAVVLCDRFADSTTAYQGGARGLSMEVIARLHELATAGVWPDLTLVLDVPAEEGLARARRLRGPDRLEGEPLDFHRRVREAFLALAAREPARVKVIDGTQSVDTVASAIWAHVEPVVRLRQ